MIVMIKQTKTVLVMGIMLKEKHTHIVKDDNKKDKIMQMFMKD